MNAAVASGDLPTAEARAFTVLREASHFGPQDPRLQITLESIKALAAREWTAARASYPRFAEESLRLLGREAGPTHPLALRTLVDLAGYLKARGENASAAARLEEIRKRTAGDAANANFWIVATLALAEIEVAMQRPERAEPLAAQARELANRAFGPDNPYAFQALFIASRVARMGGRAADAERDLRGALALAAEFVPNHPHVALARLDLGTLLLELCRHDEAKREIQAAADALVATVGGADASVVDAFRMLATAERLRGDLPAARLAAERALASAEELSARSESDAPGSRVRLLDANVRLADIDLALDRAADAKTRLERVQSLLDPLVDAGAGARLNARLALAEASVGNAPRAAELAEEALASADSGRLAPPDATDVRVHAAETFVRIGESARAEGPAKRAVAMLERTTVGTEPMLRALGALAEGQAASGRGEAALETLWRARSVGGGCFGASSALLESIARQEAAVLAALGRGGEASAASSRADAIAELGERHTASPEPGAQRLEDREMNFALRLPPPPWTPIAPEPGGLTPLHVFGRAEPSMLFEIFAHDTGAPADLLDEEILVRTLDRVAASRQHMQARLISRKEREIHGIVGVQLVNRVSDAGSTWYEVQWFGGRAGIVYIQSLRSRETTLDSLGVEAQELFEGLSVLDPTRVASRLAETRGFRSERFGYRIDLSGTDFVMLEKRGWPEQVEFAAKLPDVDLRIASLLVIPVSLSGIEADPEMVDAALCFMIEPQLTGWRSRGAAGATGSRDREYEATLLPGAEPISYRARILRRDGVAVAVGVIVRRASQAEAASLLDATAGLRLLESVPAPAPAVPEDRERLRQTLFLNGLGVAYARAARYAESIPFFERGVELAPRDAMAARNLAEARFRAGRTRDSVVGLDRALARFPRDPMLLGWRGLGHAALGQDEAAVSDLRQAIELGSTAEEVLAAYVLALVRTKRFEEALEELATRIEQTNSPAARILRSSVLRRAGRNQEAIAELRRLSKEHPSDLAIHGAMAEAAIEAGDPEAFLEATDELVGPDGESDLLVLHLRALAHQSMGHEREAIESLDRALELAPDSVELRALRRALREVGADGRGI